jgi:hypothetical protein
VKFQRLLAVLALAVTAPAIAVTGLAEAAIGVAAAARGASGPAQHATPMSPPPSSLARFGIRLLQAPVSERSNPRARLDIIDSLHPGTVIHRLIRVGDLGSTPVKLRIYAAAAVIRQGQFLPANGQYRQDQMTTWIRVRHPLVRLRPGGKRDVMVTIAVPHDAPQGEQYGIIWAQGASALHGRHVGNVTLVNRVGIRIYLAVGPGGGPPSSFTLGSMSATMTRTGTESASVEVHNTGGRALDLTGRLSLTSQSGGLRAGPYPAAHTIIAPGQSFPVRVALPTKLPSGPWHAVIELTSGGLAHSERATIAFTAAGGGSKFPAIPVTALALILLALAVAVVLVRRSRRRRPRRARRAVTGAQRV